MLILARHGRTAVNAAGRLLGRADPSLDEIGRAQAVAVADAVGPVDRVISSPLARCRETAACFGLPVEVDDRWIELDYGDHEGVALADVPAEIWTAWRADADYALPGGESLSSLGTRVRAAADELMAGDVTGAAGMVVVVTHVSPVKAAVAWALGVGDEVAWRTFVAPASLTRIRLGSAGPTLVSFNETWHLR